MGRSKLPIKKIENTINRQVTFSKRRYGLIKKAYEIAVLCDIDLALIMFSPSGRLSHFSGRKRIEDVIYRYIDLSDRDRGGTIQNREQIFNTLLKIKNEKDLAMQSTAAPGSDIEEMQKEIHDLQNQLESAEEQLRVFEPNSENISSLEEFQSCEERLLEALRRVTQRKRILLSKVEQQSSYHDTIQQINTVVQYITEAQAHGTTVASLDDHAIGFSNGDHDHMNIGSDESSAILRDGLSPTVNYECGSQSQTSGNEVNAYALPPQAQAVVEVEGCQSNNPSTDDASQQYDCSKDLFTSFMHPADHTSTSSLDKAPAEAAFTTPINQQPMFLTSQDHQLPSSELHL
ncbi:hypothetical protein ACJIZ3_004802 [Penstemon smallii]|uniref:MADS-box domain-containing protein n=1 Tax=Penstemon smallii TaxID=265156 RepID=A0ABD3S386_9LAMI